LDRSLFRFPRTFTNEFLGEPYDLGGKKHVIPSRLVRDSSDDVG
jgi:hypothetical protein